MAADFAIFCSRMGTSTLNHPPFPFSRAVNNENVFKSSFGELTNFVGNCVPKLLSSKPGKGILILIQSWSLDIIISRRRKPGLMLMLWVSFSKEITEVTRNIQARVKQELSNIIEDTFSAYNIWKGRNFDEINKGTACALGSEKYDKRSKDSFL